MSHFDIRDVFGDVMRRVQFGENCEPWNKCPEPIQAQWRNYADRMIRSLAAAGIDLSIHQQGRLKSAVTDGDQVLRE